MYAERKLTQHVPSPLERAKLEIADANVGFNVRLWRWRSPASMYATSSGHLI